MNIDYSIDTGLTIDCDRIQHMVTQIATIGALPNGGIRRLAFSPEDIQARALVRCWMHDAGMQVTVDAAGNLIGRYPGQLPHAPALATGSHIDSVPDGGIYDGTYGVLAGIEVVHTLCHHNIRLAHPVEVIVFADEENTMVGSKAMAGQPLTDADLPTQLSHIGGSWPQLTSARRDTRDLIAFVELHIEQGPVLEAVGAAIGLVTGIVGQRRYRITIDGSASHAGTTPMAMRQDALVAASQVVMAVHRIGTQQDGILTGDQVATVGAVDITPNVANTIPGIVEMTVDMRDLSNPCLDAMAASLNTALQAIAMATHTQISMEATLRNEPAPVNSHIYNTIETVTHRLGLTSHPLPSRASHDAQNIACITDMAMIFVPSQGGISHAATEYTRPECCVRGANVLLHTLLQLDQHYRSQRTAPPSTATISNPH